MTTPYIVTFDNIYLWVVHICTYLTHVYIIVCSSAYATYEPQEALMVSGCCTRWLHNTLINRAIYGVTLCTHLCT